MPKIKIKFKVTLVKGMQLTSIRFQLNGLNRDELRDIVDNYTYEGTVEIWPPSGNSIEVGLTGIGDLNLKGSFNCSLNGKNLFVQDPELLVNDNGKFRYANPEVTLP